MNAMITDEDDESNNNIILVVKTAEAAEAKAKTLMSGSIPNENLIWSTAADSVHSDDPTSQDRTDPLEDNLSDDDDVVATTTATQSEDDSIKLCEEGFSSSALDDDYHHKKDDDYSSNNNELQASSQSQSDSTETERCHLSQDTFSFLIYSPVCSRTFFLATFVFAFQISIYFVLAYETIDRFNGQNPIMKNPLHVPVNVEVPVRIAEVFAIVVAIITQDDLHKAFHLIRCGFDQDLPRAFPGTTKPKWIWSILLRAIEGLFGLAVTFILIMRAPTVLELLLNFLAMEFVSQLDDAVFVLMGQGFFGRAMQKEAKILSKTVYHVGEDVARSRVECCHCRCCCTCFSATCFTFTLIFIIMFGAWFHIASYQHSSMFGCWGIFLRFDDDKLYATFSGLYKYEWGKNFNFASRSTYYRDEVLLAYCKDENRWTLSQPKTQNRASNKDDWDPCSWDVAAPVLQQTEEDFDVLKTAYSPWFVNNTEGLWFENKPRGIISLLPPDVACESEDEYFNRIRKFPSREDMMFSNTSNYTSHNYTSNTSNYTSHNYTSNTSSYGNR